MREYRADCQRNPLTPACKHRTDSPEHSLFAQLQEVGTHFLRDQQFLGTISYWVTIEAVNCRLISQLTVPNPLCGNQPDAYFHCKALVSSPSGVYVTRHDMASNFACTCCDRTNGRFGAEARPLGTTHGQGAPHFPRHNPNGDYSR